MDSKQYASFARQLRQLPELNSCTRFYIVALDRAKPGLCGGGAVVTIDAEAGKLHLHSLRGTAYPASEKPDDDDAFFSPKEDGEDEKDDSSVQWNGVTLTFSADDGTQKESEACRLPGFDGDPPLFFHVTRQGDGVTILEDFAPHPIVYLNAGALPIKTDGKLLHRHQYLVEPPACPARAKRRQEHDKAFDALMAYTDSLIEQNRTRLLQFGCPKEDVEPLACYFWRCSLYDVEDYPTRAHESWMAEARPQIRRTTENL